MSEDLLRIRDPELPQGLLSRPAMTTLDLALVRGATTVVWGGSASGKSALARAVLQATVSNPSAQNRLRCALAPSSPYLCFEGILRSVAGEIRWAAQRAGRILHDRELADILRAADLVTLADRDIWSLSGGEAVRAALAMLGASRPDLIVVDDLLGSLDSHSLRIGLKLLEDETRLGAAVLILQTPSAALKRALAGANATVLLPDPPRTVNDDIDQAVKRLVAALPEVSPADLLFSDLSYGYGGGLQFGLSRARLQMGRCYASWEPNGAGKTTFLRMMGGIISTTGSLTTTATANGVGLQLGSRQGRQAAAFFQMQEPQYQLGGRTVADEIAAATRGAGRELRAVAPVMAEALFGRGVLAANPFSLPRPFQRLLMAFLACVSGRPILLLDEPTIGLDDSLKTILRGLLSATAACARLVLVATHDVPFAESLGAEPLQLGVRRVHTVGEGRSSIHL